MMTKKICLKISLALLLLSIGVEGYTQGYQKEEEIPANPMHLSAQIMTTPNSNRRLLAVSFFNLEHWHSYWQNPGDAGLPIKATFTIASNGAAATVNTLELPSPQRFIEPGNMWAYGHEGEYTYFYEPASNINQPMRAEITWLICKNICIPGKATLDIPWPTGAEITISPAIIAKKPLANTELEKRFASLPKTVNFPESMTMQLVANSSGEQPLALYYEMTGVNPSQLPINRNFLTPFQLAPFDFNHEELFWDGNNKLVGRILVGWDGQYQEPEIPLPADGAFKKPFILNFAFFNPLNGETHYISKTFNHFVLKTDLHQRISALKPIAIEDLQKKSASVGAEKNNTASAPSDETIWPYLFLALFGGLILNIMPCVLPVISIKLFGLLKMRQESPKKLVVHNLMYTAGVLSSFILLAIVIIALKSAGTMVGWGFQLQSPKFVFLMILILFIFALNLFEMFEFKTPGGKILGQMRLEEGPIGDFFSGVLATILSTPCSAPLLGTALTFAFNSSEVVITLIFLFIGIGLALPFIITAAFPKLIQFLPRPGQWMIHVKKFLGLTLILTCIWLIDVFVALNDGGVPLMKLLTILTLLFFFFYFRLHISRTNRLGTMIFLVAFTMTLSLLRAPSASGNSSRGLIADKQNSGLAWKPWSEQAMQDLKGKTVFIDFTAKWCFTCKVNEKLILETDSFKKLVDERKIELLLADWTRHDPVIGEYLRKNGMVGVPAYFVQQSDGTLINLGETISLQEIESHLK